MYKLYSLKPSNYLGKRYFRFTFNSKIKFKVNFSMLICINFIIFILYMCSRQFICMKFLGANVTVLYLFIIYRRKLVFLIEFETKKATAMRMMK